MVPDMFKGMLNGIIMALGIQHKIAYWKIFSNWVIYPILIWYFAFHLKWAVQGIWISKLLLELLNLTANVVVIEMEDWDKVGIKV